FHLAAEDKSLYPRMKASPDPAVARTASEFAKDMGGLADAYAEFVGNWPTGISIFENPEAFRTEAELVLSILTRRIERENQVLYPLADTMISVGQIDLNQTTT
ncbi:MAG: hemerythrin domain-containing protein, partial [Pseudomonadota bacterium]